MTNNNHFNDYLRKHYYCKDSEIEEVRTQVYKNKNISDFTSMVTILKSTWFKNKAEVKPLVINGSIFLDITVRYFQRVTPEEVEELEKNLSKQLTHSNILLSMKNTSEENFNNIRCMEH